MSSENPKHKRQRGVVSPEKKMQKYHWDLKQLKRYAVFRLFWAGAHMLKSVGCQKQKSIWKVSGAVGWLDDAGHGVIFECIPSSVFLVASFNFSIVASCWLIPCESGKPTGTAMQRSAISVHMGKETRCYSRRFRAPGQCFLLPRASTSFFDATLRKRDAWSAEVEIFGAADLSRNCLRHLHRWQSWHKLFVLCPSGCGPNCLASCHHCKFSVWQLASVEAIKSLCFSELKVSKSHATPKPS